MDYRTLRSGVYCCSPRTIAPSRATEPPTVLCVYKPPAAASTLPSLHCRGQRAVRFKLYATEDNDAHYVDETGMRELASFLMELPQGWADCEAVRRRGTDGYPIKVCGPLIKVAAEPVKFSGNIVAGSWSGRCS